MPDDARKWLDSVDKGEGYPTGFDAVSHLRRLVTENETLREFRCGWCGKSAGEEHGLHIVGSYAKEALDA